MITKYIPKDESKIKKSIIPVIQTIVICLFIYLTK